MEQSETIHWLGVIPLFGHIWAMRGRRAATDERKSPLVTRYNRATVAISSTLILVSLALFAEGAGAEAPSSQDLESAAEARERVRESREAELDRVLQEMLEREGIGSADTEKASSEERGAAVRLIWDLAKKAWQNPWIRFLVVGIVLMNVATLGAVILTVYMSLNVSYQAARYLSYVFPFFVGLFCVVKAASGEWLALLGVLAAMFAHAYSRILDKFQGRVLPVFDEVLFHQRAQKRARKLIGSLNASDFKDLRTLEAYGAMEDQEGENSGVHFFLMEDFQKAEEKFRSGIQSGDPVAMNNLAAMYESGISPISTNEACEENGWTSSFESVLWGTRERIARDLYQQSADLGLLVAKVNLANLVIGDSMMKGGWENTIFSESEVIEAVRALSSASNHRAWRAARSLRRAKSLLPPDLVRRALSDDWPSPSQV